MSKYSQQEIIEFYKEGKTVYNPNGQVECFMFNNKMYSSNRNRNKMYSFDDKDWTLNRMNYTTLNKIFNIFTLRFHKLTPCEKSKKVGL